MKYLTTLILFLFLAACGTPGGFMSPGTTGAPATGTTLAQTARDQSTVPGTSTGGTATINYYMASAVPPSVSSKLLELAAAEKWTPEQIESALRAAAGAPESVSITGTVTNQAGDAENLGAGSGGSGAASGGSVQRP